MKIKHSGFAGAVQRNAMLILIVSLSILLLPYIIPSLFADRLSEGGDMQWLGAGLSSLSVLAIPAMALSIYAAFQLKRKPLEANPVPAEEAMGPSQLLIGVPEGTVKSRVDKVIFRVALVVWLVVWFFIHYFAIGIVFFPCAAAGCGDAGLGLLVVPYAWPTTFVLVGSLLNRIGSGEYRGGAKGGCHSRTISHPSIRHFASRGTATELSIVRFLFAASGI